MTAANPLASDPGQREAAPNSTASYHGQPVIKEPVWTWEIPCYLFSGGLAGASSGLAYLAERRDQLGLARRAWVVALTCNAISPVLLISDLGKPARFLNMLRMFKITSPMSVGSWVLTANGVGAGIRVANMWFHVFPRTARVARVAAALMGLPLATYTAALVSNTAIPAWHEARRELPFVFAAGAALSAGAVAVVLNPVEDAAPARRLALGGALAEVALKELMERRLGEHGEPYKRGAAAKLGRLGQACIVGGAALLASQGRTSRAAAAAAGTLLCAGALSARWSVFKAGFQSAADPRYVVGPQRALIERGDRRGASRREAKLDAADPALGSPATTLGT